MAPNSVCDMGAIGSGSDGPAPGATSRSTVWPAGFWIASPNGSRVMTARAPPGAVTTICPAPTETPTLEPEARALAGAAESTATTPASRSRRVVALIGPAGWRRIAGKPTEGRAGGTPLRPGGLRGQVAWCGSPACSPTGSRMKLSIAMSGSTWLSLMNAITLRPVMLSTPATRSSRMTP